MKPFLLDQDTKTEEKKSEEENKSPYLRKRTSKMQTTPMKKPVRSAELERAAKKEEPFRELDVRRNIFQ